MKDQILAGINRLGEGKVFSAKDFLDIATRGTIDVALGDLTREGTIRRISGGLYDLPKVNVVLGGKLSPDIDEAARAIARRQRWKIVPEGAWAANLLGLSTQVPAKIVYLTDGPNSEVPIGRRTIHFKTCAPKSNGRTRRQKRACSSGTTVSRPGQDRSPRDRNATEHLISGRKTQPYERCPIRCRLDLRNGKKAGGGVGLNRIAQMAAGERADVFSETADRNGLAGAGIAGSGQR
jgi:hypothetical protein